MLRLSADSKGRRWAFVHHAPFDAVLVDAPLVDAPQVIQLGCPVLPLSRGQAAWPGEGLRWPLAANDLMQQLERVAASWDSQDRDRAAPPSGAATDSPSASPAHTTAPTAGAATPLAQAPGPVSPRLDLGATAWTAIPTLSPQARYRLRRWPPALLLRGERARMRLASLLSRQALLMPELVALAGVSELQCEVFLAELHGMGLLQIQSHDRVSAPHANLQPQNPQRDAELAYHSDSVTEDTSSQRLAARSPRVAAGIAQGLIHRIRQRLRI